MRTIPAFALLVAAACAPHAPAPVTPARTPVSAAPTPTPTPVPAPRTLAREAPPLPTIPLAEGPLSPKLVFPEPNASIAVRDSNFVFGSVGNGRATLTINGAPVPVAPNGAFVAYLPVPPPTAPRYEVVARTATDSARIVVPVRVPPVRPELPLTGRLVVDTASVTPRGTALMLRDDEPVRVSVRAPANASAWVGSNRDERPLVNVGGNSFATDVPARQLRSATTLYVARGSDTVRFALTRVSNPDTLSAPLVVLGDPPTASDPDAQVFGRPTPAGTYKWMLIPGTVVARTGRIGDNVRVRLDSQLEVWIDASSVKPLPAGTPVPRRVVGAMGLGPGAEWVDVVFPISAAPPFLIEEETNRITVTLYGTQASPDIIKFRQNDSLVRMINWVPESSDRVRFSLEMTQAPYGYLALWDPARGFVLRIRRAPRVEARRPLAGITIVVDPGHPPGGAIGPTSLTEPKAALDVGRRLARMLEERGARVVMTRTTMEPVDLKLRSVIARRENAHALVSVHLNAFGDGVNPFVNNGTSTLFFHPQAEPLARLVQSGMMGEMGLRDLGIHYQNISIGRTSWMPAIICEGAFLMIPQQEYALTTPEFQTRYARGIADGVEAYFRSLAR